MDTEFEQMDKIVLADTLRQFYPAAKQKNKLGEDTGKPYAKKSLINI